MKLIKVGFSGGGLGKANGSEVAPDEIIKSLYDLYSNEDGFFNEFQIEAVDVVNSLKKPSSLEYKSYNDFIISSGATSLPFAFPSPPPEKPTLINFIKKIITKII